jgi:ketosteroid isomerase-like protein
VHGWDGVLAFMANQMPAFEEGSMWIEPLEYIDAGDRLIVPYRFGGRAHHTGIDMEFSFVHVFTQRRGKTVRVDVYETKDEAMSDIRLSSHSNVALVREHFENTNDRRFDAAMRGYDPDVELVVSDDVAVDPGVYRGTDAVGKWFGSWFGTFAPDYRMDVIELIPAGDSAVLAVVDHRGVGRSSGAEVTTRYYNAYWVRDGKIARLQLFRERADALAAVGLADEPSSPPTG